MITLKVGMRVKGDGIHDGISISGNTGKVIRVDGDPDDEWTMYSVRWDKENSRFHDCGGRCDKLHGWNVDRTHLTPINDEQFIVEWEEVKKK